MSIKILKDHLKLKFPDSVLVPQTEDKHPKKAHLGLTAKEIRRTVGPGRHKTWGILLGDDLVCIDFDNMLKHNEWVERFPADFGTAPWETTRHGHHYYFQNDEGYTNKTGIVPKVDFLAIEANGTRRNCVCAPSSGKEWQRCIVDTETKPMSAELKAYITELRTPQDTDDTEEVSTQRTVLPMSKLKKQLKTFDATKFEAHDDWFGIMCFVHGQNDDGDAALDSDLLRMFELWSKPMSNYNRSDLYSRWRTLGSEQSNQVGIPYLLKLIAKHDVKDHISEKQKDLIDGDAIDAMHIFNSVHGDKFCMCHGNRWGYDERSGLWKVDKNRHLLRYYAMQVEELQEYARDPRPMDRMLTLVEAQLPRRNNLVELIDRSSIGYLVFDDGVYDMKTGALNPHSPKYYANRSIPRTFKPRSEVCPKATERIRKSVEDVFPDKTLLNYWLQIVGYSAAGGNPLRLFFLNIGDTGSGKGYCQALVNEAFRGYVETIKPNMYMQSDRQNSEGAEPERRKLLASRFALAEEPSMKTKLDGNKIKMDAGDGGLVSCRTLNEEPVTFTLIHTTHMFGNDMPEITPLDDAVKDRVRIVKFEQQFLNEGDPKFDPTKHKLRDNALKRNMQDDINLVWAAFYMFIDGYQKYCGNGRMIDTPDIVRTSTDEHFAASATWESIFWENYSKGGKRDKVSFKSIQQTMEANSVDMSRRKLGLSLKNVLGLTSDSHNFYSGLTYKCDDDF